ncbi:MAG: penicillin acylase family protein [Endozoicomonas sp.]
MAVWLKKGAVLALSLLLLSFLIIYVLLIRSLPILEGDKTVPWIKAAVSVHRDSMGIPVIKGQSRTDVAFATGYLHAQERFFQMDLNRRNSAGELSELFGELALEHDKRQRMHQFRKVAGQVVSRMSANKLSVLNAYTAGVNQGLKDLGSKPFEYWLLNAEAVPWRNEDTYLTVFSMYLDLNDDEVRLDNAKGFLSRVTSPEVIEFLSPLGTRWDSPLDEGELPALATPGVDQVNLREKSADFYAGLTGTLLEDAMIGSNNWAVSGHLTDHGAAIVEDDMHLNHRVPTIWYRAQLRYPHPVQTGEELTITGVTLPGAPIIVVGSNGKVAWGFTNSTADWVDLVELEASADGTYRTPEGPEVLSSWTETIAVKGQQPVVVTYTGTRWGPVIDSAYDSLKYALRWTAHNPAATNVDLINLETVQDIYEAMHVANRSGIPPQNFTVGDSQGNIAWTIAGKIPRRSGLDSTYPLPWEEADSHWQEWLPTKEYPRVVNPESSRIWTANARIVSGEDYEKLGNGGYALGPRQLQIRDALMSMEKADEQSLLSVALDNRALYMENWRRLILEVLSGEARSEDIGRQSFHDHVDNWSGKAAVDDVGYRLVREYHDALNLKIMQSLGRYFLSLSDDARDDVEDGWLQKINHEGELLLRLLEARPMHWLSPEYASWEELLIETVDEVVTKLGGMEQLSEATWGQRNTSRINHPLSAALPVVGQFLNMPAAALAGDLWVPRSQKPASGVSERMVVAPGKEEQGIFHMPGGQSGHPLSPFYKAGYMDWVEGKSSPFLPGKVRYTLVLNPE